MKTKFILSMVASSLLLAGCGDQSERTGNETNAIYESVINTSLKQPSKVSFTLSGSEAAIPLPSFLLLNTQDGTLDIPVTYGASTGLDNPEVAMGEADGWSTIMPISVDLKFEGSATLKDDRVSGLSPQLIGGVVVAEATYDSQTGVITFARLLESYNGTNGATAEYVVKPNDDLKGFKIVPMAGGLKPDTNYIFALSDTVTDSNDKALGMSQSYALLKTKLIDQAGTLDKPQLLTYQIEKQLADNSALTEDNIIYSSWFTTASTGQTQLALKNAYISTVAAVPPTNAIQTPSAIWTGSANPNNLDSGTLDSLFNFTMADQTGTALETEIANDPGDHYRRTFDDPTLTSAQQDTNFNAAKAGVTAQLTGLNGSGYKLKVFKGTIKLPYFLSTDVASSGFATTPMRSGMPSVAKILSILGDASHPSNTELTQALVSDGINPGLLATSAAEQAKLIGRSYTLSETGKALDAERILTKYSPFPQIRSVEDVNYILILPELNGTLEAESVVLFEHGVTMRKELAYNFAANHAITALGQGQKPYAILAIDQPLHGQRGLAGGTIVTTPYNADPFFNLKYLPVARDNIRQGSMDAMGVRLALNKVATHTNPALSLLANKKVSLLGHSIGAITSTGTSTVANRTTGNSGLDSMFSYSASVLANPGGGIAPFLLESNSFQYTVKHGVLLSGMPEYASYYNGTCKPASTSGPVCVATYLTANASNSLGVKAAATLNAFSFAAQTVLSPVDPVNTSSIDSTGATLAIQSHGDGTIPNTTALPASGTYPLLRFDLGLTTVSADINTGSNALRVASYYNSASQAAHSTAVTPSAGTAADMHTQIVSFIAREGKGLLAGDTGKLDTTPDTTYGTP